MSRRWRRELRVLLLFLAACAVAEALDITWILVHTGLIWVVVVAAGLSGAGHRFSGKRPVLSPQPPTIRATVTDQARCQGPAGRTVPGIRSRPARLSQVTREQLLADPRSGARPL